MGDEQHSVRDRAYVLVRVHVYWTWEMTPWTWSGGGLGHRNGHDHFKIRIFQTGTVHGGDRPEFALILNNVHDDNCTCIPPIWPT
jgi:hypothetical protein